MVKPRSSFTVFAASIAVVHTYLAFAAFFSALFIGCLLHYKKIVKNGVAGYPQEWFPSVSATIGDWYPERNLFQIMIALNSGPRFALVFLQYYLQRTVSSTLSNILLVVGVLRTLSCGGWVYITSSDDHDWHDILMITYIICNLPWMYGGIKCTQDVRARRRRRIVANAFFGSLVPMIYFFVQHKVHRVPGAYTRYSFFEWALIILDVTYDSITKLDFEAAKLEISLVTSGVFRNNDISTTSSRPMSIAVPLNKPPVVADKESSAIQIETSKGASKPHQASTRSFAAPKFVKSLSGGTGFVCDVYLSYLNWSVFTSLIPTLFYFSVWQLGVAGSELALVSTLSPILLGIPHAMDLMSSRPGRTLLYALTLVGPLAYLLKSPAYRLFAVAFANVASCVGWVIDWTNPTGSRGYQSLVFALGLFLSSVSKHANHSNNPIWPFVHEPSGGYNKTGIALAILAVRNFYTRTSSPAVDDSMQEKVDSKTSAHSLPEASRSSWILDALALGSLLFSLHSFTTDPSTLIAWSWTGYPIKGPLPHLHGSLTHVAQALGILLPAVLPDAVSSDLFASPSWFAFGIFSAYITYAYSDWTGYFGGLNLVVFLMSIIPTVLGRAASNRYAVKTYTTAFLVAIIFDVSSTFTVAYAFVPGGQYFRERTDLVMIAQLACLASAFRWPRIQSSTPTFVLSKRAKAYIVHAVSIISVMSFLATMYHWPTKLPQPHRPGPRIVRAGIWTVHFGIDDEGRDSQRRMRDLIGDMELDIVGLLETDLHRINYGNRDLTRVMLEDLGFHVDLGPGPNKHTWGAILLSKYPILNSTHHLLPSPDGELAPAIHAVLDIYGTNVHVVVAHNGQEETPLDRELQATELARIMSSVYPEPLIFLGYVVTKNRAPRPAPYDIMVTDGRVHDIDQDDYDRWCEYIFYRGLYRTAYARVSRSTITDTELQIGQFIVPKHGVGVTNDTVPARYMRAWKEELPQDHWFPQQYYLQEGGVRGHYYHVFGTPLYYKIPEDAVL